jgi:hypothetical protein
MPRVHHVKKARNDNPVAKRGEPYYWWKFAYCGKSFSKTQPRQSQLTRSAFYGTLYGIQERMGDELPGVECDGLEDFISDITSDIQDLIDETQGGLDNMPEQLQDADTGQLMQERIDALEGWVSELESIDTTEYKEGFDTKENRDDWVQMTKDEITSTNPGI